MNDPIDLQESPELILTHPGYAWKGHNLPPALSLSQRLLMAQIADREDCMSLVAVPAPVNQWPG